jgi:hypothetical protein
MPCFHPLTGYRSKEFGPSGKRLITFNPNLAYQRDDPLSLACGQCIGCRLERSRQWAVRCMHEADMWEKNCFITLTFSPEALEKRSNKWSLDVTEWQKFMKRLRKKYKGFEALDDGIRPIRFYHCGEYGSMCGNCGKSQFHCSCGNFYEVLGRPHYHACLFNFDFPDKTFWRLTPSGSRLYVSDSLNEIWGHGFCTLGDVTFQSAAYCARYIMKKMNGDLAADHYRSLEEILTDIETGEVIRRDIDPEYTTMSRRSGIGKTWFDEYADDVYPHDYVVVNGKKVKPPKYYDNLLLVKDPYTYDDIKEARVINAEAKDNAHIEKFGVSNNSRERLTVREKCLKKVLELLPRNLSEDKK